MKILILGANGFIGRNIFEYFKNKYEIDIPSHTELDVLEEEQVKKYLAEGKYDVVINALDRDGNDTKYFENRLRMFCNLEKYHELYGKMIYYGSGAEYGRENAVLAVEEDLGKVIPKDTYGFCLHQMNQYARASDNIYNFRLFGIFGKYELWERRFISNAICKAICGYPITIRQERCMDYLYIDDLCKITEWAITENLQYHDYNAVSGNSYFLSELANNVNEVLGTNVPIYVAKEGRSGEYTASNRRLLSEMKGFLPESMKHSINKLAKYYKFNMNQINRETLLYNK